MTWKERRDALRQEIQTGDGRAAILACLGDSNRRVRQEGIRNVGPFLDDTEVLEALTLRLNDRSLVVRRELMPLTPRIGLKATPHLLEICRSAVGENLTLAAESLAALAEAHPDPNLRQGATQLRRRAKSWFLSPRVRSALIASATRIDSATDALKDLPRSAGPSVPPGALPVPASQPKPPVASLPLPAKVPESEPDSKLKRWWNWWNRLWEPVE